MKNYRQARFALCVVVSLLLGAQLDGLNTETHRVINSHVGQILPEFDEYLRGIGFNGGRRTELRGRSIVEWLGEGGVREDDLLRFLRHFHDPLKPWDAAGLNLMIDRYDSSVRWMQDPAQSGLDAGGSWSWGDARRLYYEALTEANAGHREELWADLFRTLGQIMHLVVDASVPEHTRNDPHPLGGLTSTSSYEYWVSRQHPTPDLEAPFIARFLASPIGFAAEILQQPAPGTETVAKVPVGRLIDADRYDGSNPGVTVSPGGPFAPVSAGLAEIANANFYSENRHHGTYPSPTDQGLIPVNLPMPSGRVRRYYSRPAGLGLLPANPLRAECVSEQYGSESPPYPCVDGLVWSQVAAHMLPRAVGYASGVLDYFFRGRLAVTRVEWTNQGVTISVRNDGAEEIDGTFEIFARHQPGSGVERRTRLAALGGGAPVRLDAGVEWRFDLTIPPDIVPTATHVLVFKGRIGLEENAVIGQVFTVPYVEVRQTSYDASLAPLCSRTPPTGAQPPFPAGVTTTLVTESMRCEWRVVNHHVSGTLDANTWLDPATGQREAILSHIEAAWKGGDVQGPAPLVLDGKPAAGGVWQRQGSEPDPTIFTIDDPTDRHRSYLYLTVTYRSGVQVAAHLPTFSWPVSSHGKTTVLDNRQPKEPQYLVASTRGISGLVAYNWQITGQMLRPLFEPVMHGGYPVPLDQRTERRFGSRVFREGLTINEEFYADDAIDVFETFSVQSAASARYAAIEPLISPHPDGPVYVPIAEVRRLYQPMEREFLRAFVTATPEPYVVPLRAEGD